MPRVPQLTRTQVVNPLPGVRQDSIATPGFLAGAGQQQAQLGQAVERAGAAASDIFARMQERENHDLVERANARLKDEYLKLDADVRQRRGQAAWGATTEVEKWFGEASSKFGGELKNGVQRQMFDQQLGQLRMQAVHSTSTFEAGERRRSLEESTNASIVGSINLAAAAVGTPTEGATIAGAKKDLIQRVESLALLNGWAQPVRDGKIAEHLSNLHNQVLQNMINTNPSGAKAYYESNRNEINGSARDGIERALAAGTLKEVVQGFADKVMAAGLTEEDALARARKELKGDEEAGAVAEIRSRFAEDRSRNAQNEKRLADEAWKAFSQRHRLRDIPATVWANLDGKTRLSIEATARSLAKEGAEKPVKTDLETYVMLRDMAVQNPEAFKNVDLRKYLHLLGKTELEQLLDLRSKPDAQLDAATLQQQLGSVHESLGWKASDREKKGAFDSTVEKMVFDEQKRLGKKLNQDERQVIIDRLIAAGEVVRGKWYLPDPNKRYYEVLGTPEEAQFVPDVPDGERAKIVEALTRAGIKPTEQEIVDRYARKLGIRR